MARKSLPRRRVLAVTGTALLGGCLGPRRSGTKPDRTASEQTKTDETKMRGTPAAEGSWAQMGRNSNHSGYNPTIPSTCSDVRWNVETDGPLTTPTVVNDRVYLTRGKSTDNAPVATLEAYDLETGKRQWSSSLDTTFTFHAPLSDLRPIYHDGVLYVNVDERFIAIDAGTRETLWKTASFEGFINDPPVVTDDAIYGAGLNGLICFEHDGSERWEFAPDEHMNHTSTPAVLDGTVYTVTNGTLVALDADSGEQLWTGESGEVMSNVIATENEIVQAGIGVKVFEPDGTERWEEDTTQKASIRPAVDDKTVYCSDLNGSVLARELSSGDLRWQRTLPEQEWSQGTIPVVTDGAVNLHRTNGEKTTVYALNAEDGKTKWKVSKKGTRSRGPIPARDTVVFTTQYTAPKQRESKTVSDGLDTTSQLWAYDI